MNRRRRQEHQQQRSSAPSSFLPIATCSSRSSDSISTSSYSIMSPTVVLLLLSITSTIIPYATSQTINVCIGTNGRMSVPSNREHHYQNLRDRYTNCTYVDGNLELTWLQDKNMDLSFLQDIREVTGYVLISHVDVKKIVIPNLQII